MRAESKWLTRKLISFGGLPVGAASREAGPQLDRAALRGAPRRARHAGLLDPSRDDLQQLLAAHQTHLQTTCVQGTRSARQLGAGPTSYTCMYICRYTIHHVLY